MKARRPQADTRSTVLPVAGNGEVTSRPREKPAEHSTVVGRYLKFPMLNFGE